MAPINSSSSWDFFTFEALAKLHRDTDSVGLLELISFQTFYYSRSIFNIFLL